MQSKDILKKRIMRELNEAAKMISNAAVEVEETGRVWEAGQMVKGAISNLLSTQYAFGQLHERGED